MEIEVPSSSRVTWTMWYRVHVFVGEAPCGLLLLSVDNSRQRTTSSVEFHYCTRSQKMTENTVEVKEEEV